VKDWRAVARANCPEIPDGDVDRIVTPLNGLEEAFRPLAKSLAPDDEPATAFRAEEAE
jgi:hypothetical protein